MRQVEHILSDFPMPDSSMMERKLLNSVLVDMNYFSELMRIVKPFGELSLTCITGAKTWI